MVCKCTTGKCNHCSCWSENVACTEECHGEDNPNCARDEIATKTSSKHVTRSKLMLPPCSNGKRCKIPTSMEHHFSHPCQYGDDCTRRNPEHFRLCTHPTLKVTDVSKAAQPCQFGADCSRKNPQHFVDFYHEPKRAKQAKQLKIEGEEAEERSAEDESGKRRCRREKDSESEEFEGTPRPKEEGAPTEEEVVKTEDREEERSKKRGKILSRHPVGSETEEEEGTKSKPKMRFSDSEEETEKSKPAKRHVKEEGKPKSCKSRAVEEEKVSQSQIAKRMRPDSEEDEDLRSVPKPKKVFKRHSTWSDEEDKPETTMDTKHAEEPVDEDATLAYVDSSADAEATLPDASPVVKDEDATAAFPMVDEDATLAYVDDMPLLALKKPLVKMESFFSKPKALDTPVHSLAAGPTLTLAPSPALDSTLPYQSDAIIFSDGEDVLDSLASPLMALSKSKYAYTVSHSPALDEIKSEARLPAMSGDDEGEMGGWRIHSKSAGRREKSAEKHASLAMKPSLITTDPSRNGATREKTAEVPQKVERIDGGKKVTKDEDVSEEEPKVRKFGRAKQLEMAEERAHKKPLTKDSESDQSDGVKPRKFGKGKPDPKSLPPKPIPKQHVSESEGSDEDRVKPRKFGKGKSSGASQPIAGKAKSLTKEASDSEAESDGIKPRKFGKGKSSGDSKRKAIKSEIGGVAPSKFGKGKTSPESKPTLKPKRDEESESDDAKSRKFVKRTQGTSSSEDSEPPPKTKGESDSEGEKKAKPGKPKKSGSVPTKKLKKRVVFD